MFNRHHRHLKIGKSLPWHHNFLIQWHCLSYINNGAEAGRLGSIQFILCLLYIQSNPVSFNLTALSQTCPKSTSFPPPPHIYLTLPYTRSPWSPFFCGEQLPKGPLHLRKENVLVTECDRVYTCLTKLCMCAVVNKHLVNLSDHRDTWDLISTMSESIKRQDQGGREVKVTEKRAEVE